jgi:hypothetical protein
VPMGIITTNSPKRRLLIKAAKDGVIIVLYFLYNFFFPIYKKIDEGY